MTTTTKDPRKLTKTEMRELHRRADDAGRKAAAETVPTPMQIVQRANPLDDTSPIVRAYEPVMDGV